jgi:hypoxanthine-DNA glycosylase
MEINPFPYYIPPDPEKLIIGSFPCFNGNDYGDWFYSGSGRNHFWPLISEVLGMPATNRKEKKMLCDLHHIALTDIGLKIERKKNNCSDANLSIIEYNIGGISKCLRSGVKRIFFTGRFVEAHFKKLFPENKLPCYVLPSPSPAANRHIGGLQEYRDLVKNKKIRNVFDYRLLKYRELLA